jgi:hypothetical protein
MSPEVCNHPVREWLYAFVEGVLDELAAEEVRLHAEGCPDCRRTILESMQAQNTAQRLSRNRLSARDHERIARWTMETLAALHGRQDQPDSDPPVGS